MISLSIHGVTKIASVDVNSSSEVLKSGWVTLQVATRDDTYDKNSKESWQSISMFFEDLETGVDSFKEQLDKAYFDWQQENTVLLKKVVEEELSDEIKAVHERHMDRS
tara:strand:- start:111 stop:434 length:324 start_codon:yes stop_codon:yes gene_type:complete